MHHGMTSGPCKSHVTGIRRPTYAITISCQRWHVQHPLSSTLPNAIFEDSHGKLLVPNGMKTNLFLAEMLVKAFDKNFSSR